jgi:hypothetical protein
MHLLRARSHSPRHVTSSHNDPHSLSGEPFVKDKPDRLASRHDPQLITARAIPADPYTAWLEQREADRRTATATASAWFGRNHRELAY